MARASLAAAFWFCRIYLNAGISRHGFGPFTKRELALGRRITVDYVPARDRLDAI